MRIVVAASTLALASAFFASARRAAPRAAAAAPRAVRAMGSSKDALGLGEDYAGKRVGLYFSAGWCPMCTRFEPSLLQFREATRSADASTAVWNSDSALPFPTRPVSRRSATPIELVLVSSDGSAEAAASRAKSLGLPAVDYAMTAELKRKFRVWSGRERPEFGDGRRAGVPAIVVLGPEGLEELQFLNAESDGAKCLGDWKDEGMW